MAVMIVCPKCKGVGKQKRKWFMIGIPAMCRTCKGVGKIAISRK